MTGSLRPHDIEKLAEVLYEHDSAHSAGGHRWASWKLASTRKQEKYQRLAAVALEFAQRITGTG